MCINGGVGVEPRRVLPCLVLSIRAHVSPAPQHFQRLRLDDLVSPLEQIHRPVGMRRLLFDNRVERLAKHERAIEKRLLAGLRQFSC